VFSFARSVLKQVATAYAFVFTGRHISERFAVLRGAMDGGEEAAAGLQALPEMHATSAGLKVHPSLVVSPIQRVNQIMFAVWHVCVLQALCTFVAAEGLEECRKCCGGHGVLLGAYIWPLPLPLAFP
jgi:acyl-CoA oxidase